MRAGGATRCVDPRSMNARATPRTLAVPHFGLDSDVRRGGSVPARLELRSTRLDHFKSFTNSSIFFAAKRARRPPTPVSTVRSGGPRSAVRWPPRAARARLSGPSVRKREITLMYLRNGSRQPCRGPFDLFPRQYTTPCSRSQTRVSSESVQSVGAGTSLRPRARHIINHSHPRVLL